MRNLFALARFLKYPVRTTEAKKLKNKRVTAILNNIYAF
jgi:hypothetical protein